MRISLQRFFSVMVGAIGLVGITTGIAVLSLGSNNMVHAAAGSCKVVLALDNSVSVGDNWTAYKNQVRSLFSPDFKLDGLQLAFWTFSNIEGSANFNKYYNDYVYQDGFYDGNKNIDFINKLKDNNILLDGGYTNYAQGFAYNASGTGPFTMTANSNSDIRRIAHGFGRDGKDPDVIGLITDGAPNHPSGRVALDGNPVAIGAAYQATKQYPNSKFFAGFINPVDEATARKYLTESVNGPGASPNAANVGPIQINSTTGVSNLSEFLKNQITESCKGSTPPSVYDLTPSITTEPKSIDAGVDTEVVPYPIITNNSSYVSDPTGWQIMRVVAPNGSSPLGNTIYDNGGKDCTWLVAQIAGSSACKQISQGNGTYSQGQNPLNSFDTIKDMVLSGEITPGKKVCYFVMLTKPTKNAIPINRYSAPACVAVNPPQPPKYTPFVQIYGGDLRVGRSIGGWANRNARVHTVPVFSNGRTFGSWVEYGVLAPGDVIGTASKSGYRGGVAGATVTDPECNTTGGNELAGLTFGNTTANCGQYGNTGLVPNFSQLFDNNSLPTEASVIDVSTVNGPLVASKNVKITSSEPIEKGKGVFISAPGLTVTISSDIQLEDGYDKVQDIPTVIIVAGNIIIEEGVENINAWLVANGSPGNISTCGPAGRSDLTLTVCDRPLTINGPVMAKHLYLQRTAFAADKDGSPAEYINLPGTTYLWEYYWSHQYGSYANSKLRTTLTVEMPPYF